MPKVVPKTFFRKTSAVFAINVWRENTVIARRLVNTRGMRAIQCDEPEESRFVSTLSYRLKKNIPCRLDRKTSTKRRQPCNFAGTSSMRKKIVNVSWFECTKSLGANRWWPR
jgi:hypothetical protein